jgi:hypothetical protein
VSAAIIAAMLKSDSIGDSVCTLVGDSVWASVRASVRASVFGSHDSGWLSFYSYFLEQCELSRCKKLQPLMQLAEVCGWWMPYKNVCILQDRHCVLNRDDQGRLHCENGMAFAYPSGWGDYYWHGHRVPELVIMRPSDITIDLIKCESSAEIRRIMIERFGVEKYLHESGAKLLDFDYVDVTPQGKKMPRALIEDAFKDRYLEGTDGSTHRVYFMRVPSTVKTCREAHEAICGLNESLCKAQS